jgi:glycine oxidase
VQIPRESTGRLSENLPAPDVLVVGAGVIGMAIAWRCAQQGLTVTICDPNPGAGASRTAAGMLAPVTELHYGEHALLDLNCRSADMFPALAAELAEITGIDIGYRQCGTVVAAWDAADLAGLRDLHALHRRLGLDSELLTTRELRAVEPELATGLPGGLLASGDHQVNPRELYRGLAAAAIAADARLVPIGVQTFRLAGDRLIGAELGDGTRIDAGVTVLAAGAWSTELPGLPTGLLPAVRPVKGQTLRLRGVSLLQHVLRGAVRGQPVYLVPREDGRVVIGASTEEAGFDVRPRAGAVYALLRDAQALLPTVGELELVEVSTGLRPGSPDNAPIIGATGLPGLIAATGHHRNGILLTPVTADAVAELLVGGELPDHLTAFGPDRFGAAPVPVAVR